MALGKTNDTVEGFQLGCPGAVDTLLLVEPEAAKAYAAATKPPTVPPDEPSRPPQVAPLKGRDGPGAHHFRD